MPPPEPAKRPVLGALAVVIRADHVLLAQRGREPDPLHWGFPGGHVELGETGLAAAARELREETGVIAQPVEYLTNVDVLRWQDGTANIHYLLAAVLCDYHSGEPVADDDIIAARWVPTAEITNGALDLHPGVQDVLTIALRRLRDRSP